MSIFTQRIIKIAGDKASMSSDIHIYRGNRNIELVFTITDHAFRFTTTDNSGSVIEAYSPSHGYVTLLTPLGTELCSGKAAIKDDKLVFKITKSMIDEHTEIGDYDLVIDLYDEAGDALLTLPAIYKQIHILERVSLVNDPTADPVAFNKETSDLSMGDSATYSSKESNIGLSQVVTYNPKTDELIAGRPKAVSASDRIKSINGIPVADQEVRDLVNQVNTTHTAQIDNLTANKADKTTTADIQQQVNNLVLQAGNPDASSAEILQARDTHATLHERFQADEGRIAAMESKSTQQDAHLNTVDTKNTEQDIRLANAEYVSRRQDIAMQGLLNEGVDNRLSLTEKDNIIKLQHSKEGMAEITSMVGDTMVNLVTNSRPFTTSPDNLLRYNNIYTPYVLKRNTVYTIIKKCNFLNEVNRIIIIEKNSQGQNVMLNLNDVALKGVFISTFTTPSTDMDGTEYRIVPHFYSNGFVTDATDQEKDYILLEGDYISKPLPDEYFEGMKSCFEDKLVTQEMVNAGKERPENLNKYRADLKIVGKNLFDISQVGGELPYKANFNNVVSFKNNIFTLEYTSAYPTILIDCTSYLKYWVGLKLKTSCKFEDSTPGVTPSRYLKGTDATGKIYYFQGYANLVIPSHLTKLELAIVFNNTSNAIAGKGSVSDIQVEIVNEDLSTPCEPYKESKQTLYLNEPLYKDNELCVHNGQLGYWKNWDSVILDGSEDEGWTRVSSSNISSYFSSSILDNRVIYPYKGYKILCDKLSDSTIWQTDNEGIAIEAGLEAVRALRVRVLSSRLSENTGVGFKQWLRQNPITVVYKLAEPIFVPILDNTPQWILNSFNECTLFVESNIPIANTTVKYTGSVPSVMAMRKDTTTNTADIADTQVAVDYLLMNNTKEPMAVMAMTAPEGRSNGLTAKGGVAMGAYFASRIMKGFLDYRAVVKRYPEFKDDIDFILRSEGREDLIVPV